MKLVNTTYAKWYSVKFRTHPARCGVGLWWTPCSCGAPCVVLQLLTLELAVHVGRLAAHRA